MTSADDDEKLHHTLRGLGARLRFARESADLSINELARRSGVDSGRISRLQVEERVSKLALNTVAQLSYALGIRLGWLLTGEEPMRPGKLSPKVQAPPPPPAEDVPTFTESAELKRLELMDRLLKLMEDSGAPSRATNQSKR